jgi:carbamoyltransferase
VELNLEYFAFLSESTMTNARFADLFEGPPRQSESLITQRERDIARSIQVVTEEAMLRMARHAHKLTGEKNLCMAGGVALNCVANGRLLREGPFHDIWIQPAAGDSGGALGAALDAYHNYFEHAHPAPVDDRSRPRGTYWGPQFSEEEIHAFLNTHGYRYRALSRADRAATIAALLEEGKVVGHFAGRMEFGPRALGARSILGDARNRDMQVNLNLKIKYRESFRPFAPSVLAEKAGDYFELTGESPYMLIVAPLRQDRRKPVQRDTSNGDLLSIVRQERSDLPAITHVDYSARIQTIGHDDHPLYYELIQRFYQLTGYAVIVNTSFNVRGEPIVCTPYDAYRCFMRTDMDVLVLGNTVLMKHEQPEWPEPKGHMPELSSAPHPPPPQEFVNGLRWIYRQEFQPVAALFKNSRLVRIPSTFEGLPSTWQEVTADQSPNKLFALPDVMDTAGPDVERLARAIADEWSPGQITEALWPVLVSLLRLGGQFAGTETLEEDVSESVYVMF